MKKIVLFIVLLLIPIVVYADNEIFRETSSVVGKEILTTGAPYKDNYVISGAILINMEETPSDFIRIVDEKGEVIKEQSISSTDIPASITVENDIIYILLLNRNYCRIEKYDSNLDKQNEIMIDECISSFYSDIDFFFNSNSLTIKDNYIYIYNSRENEMTRVKKDLSTFENITVTENDIKNINIDWYNKRRLYVETSNRKTYITTTKDYVIANIIDVSPSCPNNIDDLCNGQKIIVYDKDLNIVSEKVLSNSLSNDETIGATILATFIKGYFITNIYNTDGPNIGDLVIENSLNIYDKDWNLIQTIERNGEVASFALETKDGFLSNNVYSIFNRGTTDETSLVFFSLVSPIDVPTLDHGRVIVPSTGAAGETVTVEVKPDKGYTLGELIVIDAEGNKLPITNNSFVMGTSKVTVTALFVPENPNTGNFYVMLICLIAAISGIALITQKRKLNFLK